MVNFLNHPKEWRKASDAPTVNLAQRAKGRAVPVDVAIALTSQELFVETRSRETSPGSSIAVTPAGATLAMGNEAKEMDGRVPPHIRVIQPLLGGKVSDSNLAVRVLENALKSAGFAGSLGPKVLLETPASLTDSEKKSLTEAARSAGARKVEMVSQCLVAAVGAGLPVLEARGSMVLDLDNSSAEAGLITYGRVLHSRPLVASRQHFQQALIDAIRRESHVQICNTAAEALLRELGSAAPQDRDRSFAVGGRDLAAGLPRKIDVSAGEVYDAIHPLLDGLAREMIALIGESPTELLSDVSRDGLILTGEGADLNELDSFLSEATHVPVRRAEKFAQAGPRGLRTLLKNDDLRRALLGAPKKSASTSSRLSPTRALALSVLLLGLIASLVSVLSTTTLANTRSTPLDSTLTPLWKMSSGFFGPKVDTEPSPVTAEERRRHQQLAAENLRLRALVKLRPAAFSKGGVVAARVIAREPQGWLSWLVLDAGTPQGVKVGSPVVSGDGLLGSLASVSASSSRVMVLTNPRSIVAATVKGRKANGMLYGSNQKTCELRYLDPEAKIKVGDLVYTSGLDGKFPAGLKIGRVVQNTHPQGAVYSSVTVEPSASLSSPEVAVLKP